MYVHFIFKFTLILILLFAPVHWKSSSKASHSTTESQETNLQEDDNNIEDLPPPLLRSRSPSPPPQLPSRPPSPPPQLPSKSPSPRFQLSSSPPFQSYSLLPPVLLPSPPPSPRRLSYVGTDSCESITIQRTGSNISICLQQSGSTRNSTTITICRNNSTHSVPDFDIYVQRTRSVSVNSTITQRSYSTTIRHQYNRSADGNPLSTQSAGKFNQLNRSPSPLPEQKNKRYSFQGYLLHIREFSLNQPKKCFISYAWPKDLAVRAKLQTQLREMRDNLMEAGIEVMLDIVDMKGDIDKYMVENIRSCDKFLLVSLPFLVFYFPLNSLDMYSSTCTTDSRARVEQCSKRTE